MISPDIMGSPPVVSPTRLHAAGNQPHHRYAGTDDGRRTDQTLDAKRLTLTSGRSRGVGFRVTIPGSPERRGGLNDATSDENAVIFTKKHADEFGAVQTYIETYIGNRMTAQNQPQQVVHPAAPDIADQIRKLASLHDDGLLTEEEFQAKKAALLA